MAWPVQGSLRLWERNSRYDNSKPTSEHVDRGLCFPGGQDLQVEPAADTRWFPAITSDRRRRGSAWSIASLGLLHGGAQHR